MYNLNSHKANLSNGCIQSLRRAVRLIAGVLLLVCLAAMQGGCNSLPISLGVLEKNVDSPDAVLPDDQTTRVACEYRFGARDVRWPDFTPAAPWRLRIGCASASRLGQVA
jgi:hypothetical protein